MYKKSKNGTFEAKPGHQNSINLFMHTTTGDREFAHITDDNEFKFDPTEESLLMHPEHILELYDFVSILVTEADH